MRLGGFAWTAILFVALIPHCSTPCGDGTPCNESQVGEVCGATDCESYVCDGTQFGVLKKEPGDTCNAGVTCPSPFSNGTPGPCGGLSLVCNAQGVFAFQESVGPGVACNQQGQICPFPETECQSCTCDGKQWVCQMSANCTLDANPCSAPSIIVTGQACQAGSGCASDYACGASPSVVGTCSCIGAVWTCNAPCDAASD